MKKYIHIITRSLCIIVMMCVSVGAWADGEEPSIYEQWATALGVTYSDGLGESENPFSITNSNWSTFVQYVNGDDTADPAIEALSTEDVYFKLTENVETTTAPSTQMNISSSYFTSDSYEEEGETLYYKIIYTGVVPSSFSDGLFFSYSTDDASLVTYNFTIGSTDDWSNFTSISPGDNIYFKLTADLAFDTAPSSTSSVSSDNFDFDGHAITCTISIPTSEGHTALFFSEESGTLEANVSYVYTIGGTTEWEYLTSNFTSGIPSNVSFKLTADVDFTEGTTTPTSLPGITSSNFTAGSFSISYNGLTSFSSEGGYTTFPDDANLEKNKVKYNYSIGDIGVDWDSFVTYANENSIKSNEYFELASDIYLTSAPEASVPDAVKKTNFSFGSSSTCGVYVAVSSSFGDNDYIDFPETVVPVFATSALEAGVNYYYNITTADQLSAFVTSDLHKNANVDIRLAQGSYDLGGEMFSYPLSNKCVVSSVYDPDGTEETPTATITLPTEEDPTVVGFVGKNLFAATASSGTITYIWTKVGGNPIAVALANAFYKNAIEDTDNRGTAYNEGSIKYIAGSGTETKPYLIANYDMLKALVDYVNTNSTAESNLSEGMHIKLICDVNAQGGERLTNEKGNKIIASPIQNVQFSSAFKGNFDGNGYSLGGFTRPLFSSLDGATITKLGIVDCNMGTTTSALVAESGGSYSVSMSYVSGVSDGLIPSTDNSNASDSYAFNPANYDPETSGSGYTDYIISAETIDDISGTHSVLSGNCYNLGESKSDCTLFIPTDNTISSYYFSNTDANKLTTYYYKENFLATDAISTDGILIDNPLVCNVTMLHNVIQQEGTKVTSNAVCENDKLHETFNYLYSWYLIDKKAIKTDDLGETRIKNITYKRATAPAGLNTVYLPFAWDYANDIYDQSGNKISGAKAYILADKTSTVEGQEQFNPNGSYKDYSSATSLLFFTPSAEDFYSYSCGLPTILDVPSSGWCIKKHKDDNGWFYYVNTDGSYCYDDIELNGVTIEHLYARLEGEHDENHADGYSFMTKDRLDKMTPGRAFHCGTFTRLNNEEGDATFGNGTYKDSENNDYSCFKLAKSNGNYVFAAVTESSSVEPFRTFFAISDGGTKGASFFSSSGSAKALGFGFVDFADSGTTTQIDGIPTEGITILTAEQSKVYSLDGRYVGQYGKKLPAGLYIMNGKKFLVK